MESYGWGKQSGGLNLVMDLLFPCPEVSLHGAHSSTWTNDYVFVALTHTTGLGLTRIGPGWGSSGADPAPYL